MGLISILFRASRRTSTRRKWKAPSAKPINRPQKQYQRKVPKDIVQATEPNESFQGATVEKIIDGDTVIVSKSFHKVKIRLDSIDCPEDGQPWGDIARFGLIKLIGEWKVRLEEYGIDRYERILATIYVQNRNSEWVNVNERMVTLGHAWVMRSFYDHLPKERQDQLNRLERWAKSKKVGLWETPNPIPPWKWRNEV